MKNDKWDAASALAMIVLAIATSMNTIVLWVVASDIQEDRELTNIHIDSLRHDVMAEVKRPKTPPCQHVSWRESDVYECAGCGRLQHFTEPPENLVD